MKLSELKPGTKIQIRCKKNDLVVDLNATVAQNYGEILLLELIRKDGMVVDFSSPDVDLITIYEDGVGMPKAWVRCKIQRKVIDGEPYHALATPHPSVRVNRRKVSRVILDVPCKLILPSDSFADVRGIVHDLSGMGVGIQLNRKLEKQDHKHLRIEFENSEVEEDEEDLYGDEVDAKIRLEAQVIWKREDDKKKDYYYGCRLTHAEETLGYFMAAKMREANEQNK